MHINRDQNSVVSKLYHLLVNADDKLDRKEIYAGKLMIAIENLDEIDFKEKFESLKSLGNEQVYLNCLSELSEYNRQFQVNYLAWMNIIANSDGHIDLREWQLIYKIYHEHLNLNIDDIIQQKRILREQIKNAQPMVKFHVK